MQFGSIALAGILGVAFAITMPGCAHRGDCPLSLSPSCSPNQVCSVDRRASDDQNARFDTTTGAFPSASDIENSLAGQDPQSLETRLGLARLDQLADRSQKAETAFLKAVQEQPDNALTHSALGLFYAGEEQWERAVPHLGRAVELAPEQPELRHQYAVALAWAGEFDSAMEQFTAIGGPAEAQFQIGSIFWQQGRMHLAEEAFQRSLEFDPELASSKEMLQRLATPEVPSPHTLSANEPPSSQKGVVTVGSSGGARHAANAVWDEPL